MTDDTPDDNDKDLEDYIQSRCLKSDKISANIQIRDRNGIQKLQKDALMLKI